MQPAKVNHPIAEPELVGLHGKPFTVAVVSRSVDPKRIVLVSENGQLAKAASLDLARFLEYCPKTSIPVSGLAVRMHPHADHRRRSV